MADLYARILDGELVSVGPLPAIAKRWDTGEYVDPADWLKATGFYDIDSLAENPDQIEATPEEREAIREGIDAALQRRQRRTDAGAQLVQAANIAKDVFWDWLDAYCHPDVVPLLGGQSPNAGAEWGPLTVGQKAEVLRLGESYSAIWAVRTADALLLMRHVLEDIIATTDVDTPN